MPFVPTAIYGIDFSGAKEAGRNAWVARATIGRRGRLRLEALSSLERLAGNAAREPALAHLVALIRGSQDALWGIDFPFGLPIEVVDDGHAWEDQLAALAAWPGGAYAFGHSCVARALKSLGRMHVRRTTDAEVKAPFDCYHYRIIYQTFHGMRDVLLPLSTTRGTAVLPFQLRRLRDASRVVCEACPASTLKRLKLPHQNYKQPAGGPLTMIRRRTRHRILEGLTPLIEINATHRRVIMRNGGGDALDAVLAAAGVWHAWRTMDANAVRRHPRYTREGLVFA